VRHRSSSRWTDRNSSCILCQQGHLVGFEGMKPGLNIELAPTLTYSPSATRDEFPMGKLDWEDVSPDENVFGITGRWGVTPNASLNAAYNPDFSQVEADVAQLAVNTRFALFFPEKRPFFLEGADFFSTPLQAVFTRTVADPAFGGKLTGKFDANGVGVFIAQDEINNLIIPSNQSSELTSIFQDVGSAVARYRRDIGSGSNAGVLYTGREGDGYHNHVYGADTFVRLSPSTTLQGQFLRSETLYPDGLAEDFGQTPGNFGGNAVRLNAYHSTNKWSIWANYEDLGKDFRADSGFIPRVDTRDGILEVLRVELRTLHPADHRSRRRTDRSELALRGDLQRAPPELGLHHGRAAQGALRGRDLHALATTDGMVDSAKPRHAIHSVRADRRLHRLRQRQTRLDGRAAADRGAQAGPARQREAGP
jgi:hypothetical protein